MIVSMWVIRRPSGRRVLTCISEAIAKASLPIYGPGYTIERLTRSYPATRHKARKK